MSKERLHCWEDIYNRLIGGYPLSFKVEVK